jgi:Sucrase/ferredoxin-like
VTSCSDLARRRHEPLAGTAPTGHLWLALEQPGPWGRRALEDSHLDRSVAAALASMAADLPVRLVLVRRPGRHPDPGGTSHRTLLVARTTGAPQLWRTRLADPRDVLALDLPSLLATDPPPPGLGLEPSGDPVLLVCTNGRRDLCCALRGREAAAELTDLGHEVWESSHLGGHRFSPTVLQLPDGWLFGGSDATSLSTAACRGRSALSPTAQAAELAVLVSRGAGRPTALEVHPAGPDRFLVDGTEVRVRLESVGPVRPESCGAAPVPARAPVARLGA